jgi:hypothetical protein
MTDTVHLGLPVIEAAQAQKHVTHNEALVVLDALVMLAVIDRDLSSPPASPAEGDRYLVKAPGAGAFAGKDNQVAHYLDGSWSFHPPATGWTCYVEDEAILIAWDGSAWQAVVGSGGGGGGGGGGDPITELQNLVRLGLGTTADATNPFAARLNNALWTAKPVADGGDGNLRYKLSKESADKTLSFLFQDDFSGRAEIGLTGDDDFHFKVSADGSAWLDALIIDKASAAAKFAAGVCFTGVVSPTQITSDQNDYDPAGLAGASLLRLSSDASHTITGLAGGADGRIVFVHNCGAQPIILKDGSASSTAANRFALTGDLTVVPDALALLQYDATALRWRAVAGGGVGNSGGAAFVVVRVAATGDVDISTELEAGDSIDGVTLAEGDLVLLPAQTAAAQNGIYVVSASGAASRHSDFDAYDDHPGRFFSVKEGAANADTLWHCTSDDGGTLGATALVFSQFSAAVEAGDGNESWGNWTGTVGVTESWGNWT